MDINLTSPEQNQEQVQDMQGLYDQNYQPRYTQPPGSELFVPPTNLEVIKEYNTEENIPINVLKNNWSLLSKGLKLGFWEEKDKHEIEINKNLVMTSQIMAKPKFKFTFEDFSIQKQISFQMFVDFKRGVGMERYKINERTLQSASIQQTIQGTNQISTAKRGLFGAIRSWFS